jgi:hypothetical protein
MWSGRGTAIQVRTANCRRSAAKRKKRIAAEALSSEHLQVRQLEFDYAVPAFLEPMDPAGYDNLVVMPSERLRVVVLALWPGILGNIRKHRFLNFQWLTADENGGTSVCRGKRE